MHDVEGLGSGKKTRRNGVRYEMTSNEGLTYGGCEKGLAERAKIILV